MENLETLNTCKVRLTLFRALSFVIALFFSISIFAQSFQATNIELQFSDGRPAVKGIENVNVILKQVGVRTSLVNLPKEATTILKSSQDRALTEAEKKDLLKEFGLNRAQLLEQVQLAGRTPEGIRGGYLSIKATNGGAYPNISDLQSFPAQSRADAIKMFGKLHINMADDGMSIDETMTVISGGEFIWFFVLPDGVISKLIAPTVKMNSADQGIRVSYPGTVIHAGYFPTKGVAVGIAHGPKEFTIRFEESTVKHSELLNTNPWIDFTGSSPKLLDVIKK